MSVILGKYHMDKAPFPKNDLIQMRDTLNHWNADDSGLWKQDNIGLGHLMLWNTPESIYERLPFKSPYTNNVITSDARIDNRDELFTKLKITDHTIPDSKLILYTYDKYGKDCIHHLIGDFAFAIWDVHKEELFCARDHVGIRPFFYYVDNRQFVFASEMKGIFALKSIKPVLDKDYYLRASHFIMNKNDETPFSNIEILKSGHYLIVNQSGYQVKKYWDLDINKTIYRKNEKDYIEEVRFLFKNAIDARMRSAYPIGSQLSGGLDSSGIAKIASDNSKRDNKPFFTFTHVTTDNYKKKGLFDEKEDAELVIKKAQIENPVFIADNSQLSYFEYIEKELQLMDGPNQGVIGLMLIDLMPEVKKRNIRTLLSGHNGDLIVTAKGRGYLEEAFRKHEYKYIIDEIKLKKRPLLTSFLKTFLKSYFWKMMPIPYYKKDQVVLHDKFISQDLIQEGKRERLKFYTPNVKKYQYEMFHWNGGNRRCYVENIMMNSIKTEMRYPMFDVKLMEYCLALPNNIKVKNGYNRYFYRQLMTGLLPDKIIWGQKNGGLSSPAIQSVFDKHYEDIIAFLLQKKERNKVDSINFDKMMKHFTENRKELNAHHPMVRHHSLILYLKYFELTNSYIKFA